jgi:hypothetical protein
MAGLPVILIGFLASLAIPIVICPEAEAVAKATFLGFTVIAVMRWTRQYRGWMRHSANQRMEHYGA